jgi:hypothetical protein
MDVFLINIFVNFAKLFKKGEVPTKKSNRNSKRRTSVHHTSMLYKNPIKDTASEIKQKKKDSKDEKKESDQPPKTPISDGPDLV